MALLLENGSLGKAMRFLRCGIGARALNSGSSEFQYQLFLFPGVCPWENYLTLLSLNFLIFIMGILPLLSRVIERIKCLVLDK